MNSITGVVVAVLLVGVMGCESGATDPQDGGQDDLDGQIGTVDGAPGTIDGAPGTIDGAPGSIDAAPPECTEGGGECGTGRGCLAGVCRDECLLGFWCGESLTGEFCQAGLCVECLSASNCPGTRYECNPTSFACEDGEFDPSITRLGIFYHTWHCPSSEHVHDLSEILAGNAPYGDYYESHFWDQPAEGYYCLSDNDPLLVKHAEQLRDLGVDFVFVDVTNHAYNSNALNDRPVEMIIEPFTRMVAVWSGVTNAPRIVPWVPVVATNGSHPDSTHMIYTLLDLLGDYPGLQFEYAGKPLILVTENSTYPVDEGKLTALSANYTIRKMWAYEADGTSKWSYMEDCAASPLDDQRCLQRAATLGGELEQLPMSMAYQADYMSHPTTATPKHHGKTFRKQFETLIDNPEVPIATITGWNEWVVGRLPCDVAELCFCSNPQDVNGCFLDQYDIEYNRDIEPGANAMGDYYYLLVQSCISLFRSGGRCDAAHANDLCCKDYPG